jgi:hypothetical protein
MASVLPPEGAPQRWNASSLSRVLDATRHGFFLKFSSGCADALKRDDAAPDWRDHR